MPATALSTSSRISAADIPRFGKLGVIASFQPLHAYPDDDTLNVWAPNVGPERAQRAWAWHSIESTGGVLAFGSDWPIVTLNPWPGVQNALTRQTTEGDPPGGFVPQERSAWKTPSRPILWTRLLPGIAKKQKARSSLANWPI